MPFHTVLEPDQMGSYKKEDVVFLLQDIGQKVQEIPTGEREKLIQAGTHYSEMLPVEYQPGEGYLKLFHDTLTLYAERIAVAVGIVAEQIKQTKGLDGLVLVSLARAGTPIGVLIKRYFLFKYGRNVPHYSISIIRGRGIDEAAIDYILAHHREASLQFVDGWTGKGAITSELNEACQLYNAAHHADLLDPSLAVLADPGHCVSLFGTRDDFLIPSACLNATVSGLVSRTVLNTRYMNPGQFHGAKYYKELARDDVSNLYVDTITDAFSTVEKEVLAGFRAIEKEDRTPTWRGVQSVQTIQDRYAIQNLHFIKPGVGETTRVLLRRIPWKILINPDHTNDLSHILMLAKERHVPVEAFQDMSYSCCGLIQELD